MIMAILERQVVTNRIPVLLPEKTETAHKTGNLDFVVHDVGIIFTKDGPVILAALVQAPEDEARAAEVIQRLALLAYGELDVPPIVGSPVAGGSPVAMPVAEVGSAGSDGTHIAGD
jgi:hypothetical protein